MSEKVNAAWFSATPPSARPMGDLRELGEAWLAAVEPGLARAHEVRRRIHAWPETGGAEYETARTVRTELQGHLELESVAGTGLLGRLGPPEGPCVGIRAELDALPGTERTSVDFASANGAMHACGHDVHLAALIATIQAVSRLREATGAELPVALAPVFQPREESYPSGALDIVSCGAIAHLDIAHMVGVHVHPGVCLGEVAVGGGYINAAADEVLISVQGRGGHGAYPHDAADPVAALSNIALALPEVVRRTVGPMSAAVVSVGTMSVGEGASNVLPRHGKILATVRTTSATERTAMHTAIRVLCKGIAAAYGLTADVSVIIGEPVLRNDADLASRFARWAENLGAVVAEPLRSLGADDFSYFAEAVPSAMSFVGTSEPGIRGPSLHNSTYLPPQRVVLDVARAMIAGFLSGAETILAAAHRGQAE